MSGNQTKFEMKIASDTLQFSPPLLGTVVQFGGRSGTAVNLLFEWMQAKIPAIPLKVTKQT